MRMDDRIQYFFICPNTVECELKRTCLFVCFLLFQFCFLLVVFCLKICLLFFFPSQVTLATLSVLFWMLLKAVPQQNHSSHSAFPSALQFVWVFAFALGSSFFSSGLKKKKQTSEGSLTSSIIYLDIRIIFLTAGVMQFWSRLSRDFYRVSITREF